MRDYAELIERLRYCADRPICFSTQCDYRQTAHIGACFDSLKHEAADAIEELLAFAKFVAREAIDTGDNDGVSAEILCRKLNKLGLIETDGEFWMLPAPPYVRSRIFCDRGRCCGGVE